MFLLVKIELVPVRDNVDKVINWYENNLGVIEDDFNVDILEIIYEESNKSRNVCIYVNVDGCELDHDTVAELIANPLRKPFCMYEYTYTVLTSTYRYRPSSLNEEHNNRLINYIVERPESCSF